MKYFLLCLAQAAAISLAAPASASPFYPTEAAVFFSPNGGAENAIVKSIDSAKVRIRMQAFLFSNKEIEASGEDDIVIDDDDFVVRGSVSRVKESRNTGF